MLNPAESSTPVSTLLVGLGGYGQDYARVLLDECSTSHVELRAAVDPYPEKSPMGKVWLGKGIKIYPSLQEFYRAGNSAELVVISSPPHHHISQCREALRRGSHVFCEKPLGTTVQDIDHLLRERDRSGRQVMVGYQWSYSGSIQALKQDIRKGTWGEPRRMKSLCFWPRDLAYYHRNDWAGRIKDNQGHWILDSPAGNAMAHFLHNMFYVLGERVTSSAVPALVTAELYRAYPIENYDSIACRVITTEGIELLFYASHAIPRDLGPWFSIEFPQTEVTLGADRPEIMARDNAGNTKSYGSPDADHPFKKLFSALDVVAGKGTVMCGPEAARAQTLCINGIQDSMPDIISLPDKLKQTDAEAGRIWVNDLAQVFTECYQKGILPSEAGAPWARPGGVIDLTHYSYFPGGISPPNQGNRNINTDGNKDETT